MDRRLFLQSLLVTAVLDPERLLWAPGRKTVFIPPAPLAHGPVVVDLWHVGDIFTIEGKFATDPRKRGLMGDLQHFMVTDVGTGPDGLPLSFKPVSYVY